MDLEILNQYLSKLEGTAWVSNVFAPVHEATGKLVINFNGNVGTIDKGEVELTFLEVEAMKLPFSLLAPVLVTLADNRIETLLNTNYIEENTHLYVIKDSVNYEWWVYAKEYEAKVLPVFYGNDT